MAIEANTLGRGHPRVRIPLLRLAQHTVVWRRAQGCLGCSLSTKWKWRLSNERNTIAITHIWIESSVPFFLSFPWRLFIAQQKCLYEFPRAVLLSCRGSRVVRVNNTSSSGTVWKKIHNKNTEKKGRAGFYPMLSLFLYFDCGWAVKVLGRCSSTSVL